MNITQALSDASLKERIRQLSLKSVILLPSFLEFLVVCLLCKRTSEIHTSLGGRFLGQLLVYEQWNSLSLNIKNERIKER